MYIQCRVKVPADGSIADLCKSVADKFDVSANKVNCYILDL